MALTRYNSLKVNAGSFVNGDVVCTVAAQFRSMLGYNNGAAGYILIFDSNVVPADGTIPDYFLPIGANQGFIMNWDGMEPMDHGISWCVSSTLATKTAVGGGQVAAVVSYGPRVTQ